MHARRIDKNDLPVIARHDALNAMPRRLRLVRNSRDLFADQPVEQRRFTRIGPANQTRHNRSEISIVPSQLLCTNAAAFNSFDGEA